MNGFERLWGRFTRIAAFLGGFAIMVFETVGDHSDRPWIYAAAIGMMGLPVARAAENVLSRLSTSGPGTAPGRHDDAAAETIHEERP